MVFSPKTKLSGRKICPNGPALTESIVPGSRSTSMARGTYLPPKHIISVVNKHLSFKAKDLTLKAKVKAKDLTSEHVQRPF